MGQEVEGSDKRQEGHSLIVCGTVFLFPFYISLFWNCHLPEFLAT